MDSEKLKGIIKDKNEQLERYALSNAGCLIEAIAEQQTKIQKATERIAELRTELATLQVTQLDPSQILG